METKSSLLCERLFSIQLFQSVLRTGQPVDRRQTARSNLVVSASSTPAVPVKVTAYHRANIFQDAAPKLSSAVKLSITQTILQSSSFQFTSVRVVRPPVTYPTREILQNDDAARQGRTAGGYDFELQGSKMQRVTAEMLMCLSLLPNVANPGSSSSSLDLVPEWKSLPVEWQQYVPI